MHTDMFKYKKTCCLDPIQKFFPGKNTYSERERKQMDKYKCFMEISKRYMGILYNILKLFYIFEITSKYASI